MEVTNQLFKLHCAFRMVSDRFAVVWRPATCAAVGLVDLLHDDDAPQSDGWSGRIHRLSPRATSRGLPTSVIA